MKRLQYLISICALLSLLILIACQQFLPLLNNSKFSTPSITTSSSIASSDPSSNPSNLTSPTPQVTPPPQLKISFIDAGQADCTIVQYGNSAMIIDAGGNATTATLISIIKKMGIKEFDVVVGTHPHEDHIGGLDAVINNFQIGTIYLPNVSNNTQTFEDVLKTIQSKGLMVTMPVPGKSFTLGNDVQCTILAPNSSSYPDLNSYSIVIKMTFNGKSFIFTGDAGTDSEKEMLAKGYNLKADVLKVGHHGSASSTSLEFLKAVSPLFAVLFLGKDNPYGHPHQETISKLNSAGVKIYRTDLNGTIIIADNGANLSVRTEQ